MSLPVFSTVSGAWSRLTGRERAMLVAMAAAVAAMLLWLGFMGLSAWRDDAQRRLQRAGTDHVAVVAAARWAEGRQDATASQDLEPLIRRLAQDQNLTLTAVTTEDDGALTVDTETGASAAIFAWLANLESRGVIVRAFSAVPGPNGGLQTRIALAPVA